MDKLYAIFLTLIKPFKNFFVLTTLVFLCIILAFAETNFFLHKSTILDKINDLEQKKEWYKANIDSLKQYSHFEKKDSLYIERYAREKYLMKKENEDLYIIVED